MVEPHWHVVESLLGELLDLPAERRQAYLAQSAIHPEAMRRVQELLLASGASHGFLESPESAWGEISPQGMIGQQVGVWRLTALLGTGGMGTVYLAERRDQQFVQQAALKLLAPGVMSQSMVARFREERSILARLEHPHVARLIDGGMACGSPFLVMEYVRGKPIDAWCREQCLDIHVQACSTAVSVGGIIAFDIRQNRQDDGYADGEWAVRVDVVPGVRAGSVPRRDTIAHGFRGSAIRDGRARHPMPGRLQLAAEGSALSTQQDLSLAEQLPS